MTKLTDDEIERQAKDRAHLEPDPVLCREDGFVCTACGDSRQVDVALGLPWDWMGDHRRSACQRRAQAVAKARPGNGSTLDPSGGSRRVARAKDSKDGQA
jgi:hypothetical protein